MRSWRSISPTDRCDEPRRLRMARRFGSAMMSKAVCMNRNILLAAYTAQGICGCGMRDAGSAGGVYVLRMRIVVLGATGHIGLYLTAPLAAAAPDLTATSRRPRDAQI